MNSPKKPLIILSLILAASFLMVGCAAFKNGSPPTKAEQALFNVTTNYTPTLVTVTNPPAAPGQPPTVSIVTSNIPSYNYAIGPGVQAAQGTASLIPGYGSLAGMAIGAVAAIWGWIRSTKNGTTAATLAQSIEAMREFIKQLPNGANMDLVLTNWLQQHQADTNTLNNVLTLLENDVSNPDAVIVAQQLQATINSLNSPPTPTTVKP